MLDQSSYLLGRLAEQFEQETDDELFRLRVCILSVPAALLDKTPGWRSVATSIERELFPA